MEPREGENRAALKEKAQAWRKRYEDALSAIADRQDAKLDDLVEVIWEQGILDRIAPIDAEEKRARKELRGDLWDGTRDDPELYLRIMYSAAYSVEASKRHLTVAPSSGYAGGAITRAFGAVMDRLDDFFVGEARKDPVSALSNAIVSRARRALQEHRGSAHDQVIPWGAEGVFRDIAVAVENYTLDGRVALRAKNPQDHEKLGDITRFGTVSPVELNPENFKIPEPPDFIEHTLEMSGGRVAAKRLLEIKHFLVEHHIVTDYDTSWQRAFFDATRSYEGKKLRVAVIYRKDTGISFQVEEIS